MEQITELRSRCGGRESSSQVELIQQCFVEPIVARGFRSLSRDRVQPRFVELIIEIHLIARLDVKVFKIVPRTKCNCGLWNRDAPH